MGLLRIDTFTRDGRVVVQPHGDIDLATAPEFDTALGAALDQASGSVRGVVVDLSDVGFLGSAGLPPLMSWCATGSDRGLEVAVIDNPVVRRVLEVTGVDSDLALYESLDDVPSARPDGRD